VLRTEWILDDVRKGRGWTALVLGVLLLAGATREAAATDWAKETGGFVFPAFPYGPTEAGEPMSFDAATFSAMVREVVSVLADMDFRVVTLVVDDGLSAEARRALSSIRAEHDQYRVVAVSDTEKALPGEVKTGIAATIPPGDASIRNIDGEWTINGRRSIRAIHENPYGPGDVRIYETTFTLSSEEAGRKALLDLGEVHNHAEVILNGRSGMIDHWPTYRFLVTGRLKEGENTLKVMVHHQPQPTLDTWYYRSAPPQMTGPVRLLLWP